MNPPTDHSRVGEFVRGFFSTLERQDIPAAVLHGWQGGFEGDLTDVDFVIEQSAFARLAEIVDAYCASAGWQLCQILRHESTAAFCVCSAVDDPSCAVALDACSDYQRNGTQYLTAAELLDQREPLARGGFRLSSSNELKYRVVKAAAKNKDAAASVIEFGGYPEVARQECGRWLAQRWQISLTQWDSKGLAHALKLLHQRSNPHPPLSQPATLARIAKRIFHPTGLVVVSGSANFEENAGFLKNTFGHLYFRRFQMIECWNPKRVKDLITSTLIVVPYLGNFWAKLLPADCIHHLTAGVSGDLQCKALAKHLHQRCIRRER